MKRSPIMITSLLLAAVCLTAMPAMAQQTPDTSAAGQNRNQMPRLGPQGMPIGMGYGMGYGLGWNWRYNGNSNYKFRTFDPGLGSIVITDEQLAGYPAALMSELDLTEEQSDDIIDIHRELMDDLVDLMGEIRETRDELDEMILDPETLREDITAKFVELSELRAEMYLETRDAQKDAMEVLTDEQLKLLGSRSFFYPSLIRERREELREP